MKNLKAFFPVYAILSFALIFFTSCQGSNDGTVTFDTAAFAGELGLQPADIAGVTLTTQNPDNGNKAPHQFSSNAGVIEVSVPAGKNILIELQINISPSANSPVLTYSGSVTIDIDPGEVKDITMNISPTQLKGGFVHLDTDTIAGYLGLQSSDISGIILSTQNITDAGSKSQQQYAVNTGVVEVIVPSNKNISVELEIDLNPSSTSAVLVYDGTTTINLAPREIKDLTSMSILPTETKIVIPDCQNNRIVQINSVADGSNNWKALTYDKLSYSNSSSFFPSDISFDGIGKIYIANKTGLSTTYATTTILRIDNLVTPNPTAIVVSNPNPTLGVPSYDSIRTVSIDMINQYIYFIGNRNTRDATGGITTQANSLNRVNLNGGSVPYTNTTLFGLTDVFNAKVDSDGLLYVLRYNANTSTFTIEKYDPNAASGSLYSNVLNYTGSVQTSFGILVKPDYVLVSAPPHLYTNTSNGITQFSKNLTLMNQSIGTNNSSNTSLSMNFYTPHEFFAVLNRKITIADVTYAQAGDRLASIDDPSGTGWLTFGSFGSGTGFFNFSYS
jgi:hypothetical protein